MASSVSKHTAALANKRDAAAVRPVLNAIRTGETATVALVNELRTDHATFRTVIDALKTAVNALKTADGGTTAAIDAVTASPPAAISAAALSAQLEE